MSATDRHLSLEEMAQYHGRTMPLDEFVASYRHLVTCDPCGACYRDIYRIPDKDAPIQIIMEGVLPEKDLHLDFDEQIEPYLEQTLDQIEREIVEDHLAVCVACRDEVKSLQQLRASLQQPEPVRPRPSVWERWQMVWPWPLPWKPVHVVALLLILTLTAALTILLLPKRQGGGQVAQREEPAPPNITAATPQTSVSPSPAQSLSPPPAESKVVKRSGEPEHATSAGSSHTRGSRTSRTPPPVAPSVLPNEELVSLHDAGGRIVLTRGGTLEGLPPMAATTRQVIEEALVDENLPRPEILTTLTPPPDTTRGPQESTAASFHLFAPRRQVIVEDRPTFKWEPLAEATSYEVQVFDTRYRQVAGSPLLSPTTHIWRPATPLKRGEIYRWTVRALKEGKEITPAGMTEDFKVLEQEKMEELKRLQRSPVSHLALGIFYAQAGMVDEAEKEFQLLEKANPHSGLVKKLLAQVRSWKGH